MIKILSAEQIREADRYTMEHEPISSTNLMERAATAFVEIFSATYSSTNSIHIFCGFGNNGGDGLAIARLLLQKNYSVAVYLLADSNNYSADLLVNLARLKEINEQCIHYVATVADVNAISDNAIIVDALFGSGLNRSLTGLHAEVVTFLNNQKNIRVAVDIPSGLFADSVSEGLIFSADHTITFHQPKLSFLFPENFSVVGRWETAAIGLHKDFIESVPTLHFIPERADVKAMLPARGKFDHKGTFGHAFIHAGNHGKMGAGILCSAACMRTGAGLTTVHVPEKTENILNGAIPEVMTLSYSEKIRKEYNWTGFSAAGFGPGIGTDKTAVNIFLHLIKNVSVPTVFDADALNIISRQKKGLNLLPKHCIITPHLKEFERLAGQTNNWYERHQRQLQISKQHSIYIILKGAFTCITTPEGLSYFNPTGNPGMAKGGSGDVLTGIIAGLLAQHYNPLHACLLGVYLHGLAGDIAVNKTSLQSLSASDIIANIGNAFNSLSAE
ncbi:MAG: NAD(P)H-hydrate dehydratase [Chitinophagales bacterium]